MAKVLTPIDMAANDTALMLVSLANNIVSTLATEVVTVNSHADGALTVGNGYVSGIFGTSVLVGGEVRGGAINASANLVLTSNLVGTNSSIYISVGNTSINSAIINAESLVVNSAAINYFTLNQLTLGNTTISGVTFQANSLANQVFDSFPLSQYRSAEYLLSMQDTSPSGNAYQVMKILVVQDGAVSHITEYGIVTSNGNIATINTTANATHVQLLVTPITATNVELQATRTVMST